MAIWTQVTPSSTNSASLIQLCSGFLQSSRTEYNGSLTYNNLLRLLNQSNNDDKKDVFQMHLYQDSAESPYDMVLAEYLTLKRDNNNKATKYDWCLTVGVSPDTSKTAQQLLQILKAEVYNQMTNDSRKTSIWIVTRDAQTFTSTSKFDQIYQALLADGNVTFDPPPQQPGKKEAAYGAFKTNFGNVNLYFRQIQKIK